MVQAHTTCGIWRDLLRRQENSKYVFATLKRDIDEKSRQRYIVICLAMRYAFVEQNRDMPRTARCEDDTTATKSPSHARQ